MTTFALITEGVTDQAVIDVLVCSYYRSKNIGDIHINPIQPLQDATDEARSGNYGGWERVLELCSSRERILGHIATNDYLIIQIDTDCGEHPNFGVPLTIDGVAKPVSQLIEETIAVIVSKIGEEFFESHRRKFIFAVTVYSLECWFLPLYERLNSHRHRIRSCDDHLGAALIKKGIKYSKTYRFYHEISKEFKNNKNISLAKAHNEKSRYFSCWTPGIAGVGG